MLGLFCGKRLGTKRGSDDLEARFGVRVKILEFLL